MSHLVNHVNKFRNKFKKQVCKTYVMHTGKYKEENNIIFLPIYMCMLLYFHLSNPYIVHIFIQM
jgi:hypothetical protein